MGYTRVVLFVKQFGGATCILLMKHFILCQMSSLGMFHYQWKKVNQFFNLFSETYKNFKSRYAPVLYFPLMFSSIYQCPWLKLQNQAQVRGRALLK
jgi:hypothetical protein